MSQNIQGYRAAVLRLATATKRGGGGRRLLHLSKSLSKLGSQVLFLARVCKLDAESAGKSRSTNRIIQGGSKRGSN